MVDKLLKHFDDAMGKLTKHCDARIDSLADSVATMKKKTTKPRRWNLQPWKRRRWDSMRGHDVTNLFLTNEIQRG